MLLPGSALNLRLKILYLVEIQIGVIEPVCQIKAVVDIIDVRREVLRRRVLLGWDGCILFGILRLVKMLDNKGDALAVVSGLAESMQVNDCKKAQGCGCCQQEPERVLSFIK